MKKKVTKLSLNKSVIASLNLNTLKGGMTIAEDSYRCYTIVNHSCGNHMPECIVLTADVPETCGLPDPNSEPNPRPSCTQPCYSRPNRCA